MDTSLFGIAVPLAHAGHPAEWLPYFAPVVILALAWLVIRIKEAAAEPEERDDRSAERDGDGDEASAGDEVAHR